MKRFYKILIIAVIFIIATKTHCQPPPPPPLNYCLKFNSISLYNIRDVSVDIKWSKCSSKAVLSYYNLMYYIGDSSNATRIKLKNYKDSSYHITGLIANKYYKLKLTIVDTFYHKSDFITDSFTTALNRTIDINNNSLSKFDFKVMPVPVDGKLILDILKDNRYTAEFRIFNSTGQMVYSEIITGQGNLTKILNLKNLSKGIYFIRGTNNFESKTLKFCIN